MLRRFFISNKIFFEITIKNHKMYFFNHLLKIVFNSISVILWVKFPQLFLSAIINEKNFTKALTYVVLATAITITWIYIERKITLSQNKIMQEISLELKKPIHEKIIRNASTAFEDNEYFNSMNRALNYTEDAGNSVINILSDTSSNIISVIGISYILGEVNLWLIFALIGTSVVAHLFMKKTNKMWFLFQQNERLPMVRFIRYLNNIFSNKNFVNEIKMNGAIDFLEGILQKNTMNFTECEIKNDSKRFRYNYAALFLNNIQRMTCYIYFAHLLICNKIDVALYSTLFAAMIQFTECTDILFNQSLDLKNKISEADYYVDFLNNDSYEYQGKLDIGTKFNGVGFENVSFYYPNAEEPALKNISVKIQPGEKVAIVGENGSGKTTLIKILMGLYPPAEGKVFVNGIDIRKINIEKWQKLISVLFQQSICFPFSIEQNIAFGKNNHTNLLHSLNKASIKKTVDILPLKEKTNISKEFDRYGVDLSGGEMQRIALARAFYKNGSIFIFDEPSAALDPNAEYKLWQELMSFGKDKTIIFISHRLSMTVEADKIILLENGKIKETGNHDELMKLKGRYYTMFTRQASNYIKQS